jgi:hypothetical protein
MQLNSERLRYTSDTGSGIDVFWHPAQVITMATPNRKYGIQHKSSQWLPLTENIPLKKSQLVIYFSFIWLNNLKFSEHRTSILFHLKYSICHPLDSITKSSRTTSHCPHP